jgi:carbonic anhydrase
VYKSKKQIKKIEIDSVQWKKNITSLIEIPLMQILDCIKKLMGGNKRFIEGRTIKPRQDMNTIKA